MTTTASPVVIQTMTRQEAQQCVQAIRRSLDSVAKELQRAEDLAYTLYEREGWKALGYGSWLECMEIEIPGKARSTYYQWLKAGTTLAELPAPSQSTRADNDGPEVRPLSTTQLRVLSRIPEPADRRAVLERARQRYGTGLSAAKLEQLVEEQLKPYRCETCGERAVVPLFHCSECQQHYYDTEAECLVCAAYARPFVGAGDQGAARYEPEPTAADEPEELALLDRQEGEPPPYAQQWQRDVALQLEDEEREAVTRNLGRALDILSVGRAGPVEEAVEYTWSHLNRHDPGLRHTLTVATLRRCTAYLVQLTAMLEAASPGDDGPEEG